MIMCTLLLLLFFLQPPGKSTEPPFSPAFVKIQVEFGNLEQSTVRNWQAAKTEADQEATRKRNLERLRDEGAKLALRALELIRDRPADPGAIDVLVWVVGALGMTAPAEEAADLLIRHHLTDPKVLRVAHLWMYDPRYRWPEKVLRALVSVDLPAERKAEVMLELARCLQFQAALSADLNVMGKRQARVMELVAGKEYLNRLKSEQPQREAEALRLYREIIDKYAERRHQDKTFGELAQAAVFEMKHLSIGKQAPDIVGEDIEGNSMRLSDYRGKVVLLDFWGHW